MGTVTSLVNALANSTSRGVEASSQLYDLVYDQLKRIARAQMRRENSGHTLQPTALVNEAYLKLSAEVLNVNDRAHFYNIVAIAMRRILVDSARSRSRKKRGGESQREPFVDAEAKNENLDWIELDEALERLEELAPDAAQIVKLHFYAGLTLRECADVLNISSRTVDRKWRFARSWLKERLGNK